MEKYKILIVEDDIVFAEATKTRLLEMGYLVSDTVTSAEEAIRSVRDDPPDLVLMDIVLNGEMDGIDAASQIRQISNIPVIYVTGYVNDEFLLRAKLTTPLGYVCKPFDTEALKAVIEVALYRHSMETVLRKRRMRMCDWRPKTNSSRRLKAWAAWPGPSPTISTIISRQ